MKYFLLTLFLSLNVLAQNTIVPGDIFPNINYDKNFIINSEAEKNFTQGVSSTMNLTGRTSSTAFVLSGQWSYFMRPSAASQTFTVSATPYTRGQWGQNCETSFTYNYGAVSAPFYASAMSGTTEVASATLTPSAASATTVHRMYFTCPDSVAVGIKITSTASSTQNLYTDKFYSGLRLSTASSGTSGSSFTLTASAPLVISGTVISITKATSSTDGYLSSTDYNTFNNGLSDPYELIPNGNAEGANPFLAYTSAATAKPSTSGTLGAVSLTAVLSSVNPITGTQSFIINKTGGNAQGQQAVIPFNIAANKNMAAHTINFDYRVASGTFTAGLVASATLTYSSLIAYVYDVSGSTFIEPSSFVLTQNSSSTVSRFTTTFQPVTSNTSYRLIFHTATTNTASFGLQVDNISVTPNKISHTDEVVAIYYASASGSTGPATAINFDTKVLDSHNSVSILAGVWRFYAIRAGVYCLSMNTNVNANNTASLYKNGTAYSNLTAIVAGQTYSGTQCAPMVTGDYLDVRTAGNVTYIGANSGGQVTMVTVRRVGN